MRKITERVNMENSGVYCMVKGLLSPDWNEESLIKGRREGLADNQKLTFMFSFVTTSKKYAAANILA